MKNNYNNPSVGCHIDASSASADDCNLRTIKFAANYGFKFEGFIPNDEDEDYGQVISELADEALSFLNECETRSFMYWFHEDNSLFLCADVDSAREDVCFLSVRGQDYPADDYVGEWLHVSDHGNATLYVRDAGKDREVWSVV